MHTAIAPIYRDASLRFLPGYQENCSINCEAVSKMVTGGYHETCR